MDGIGKRPLVALVAAVAENDVIGASGGMPWRLPSDLRRFRSITMGKPVIMGRRTLESIGKPLDGRLNIVVTRDPAYVVEGAETAASIEEALWRARAAAGDEVIVGGGGEIYAATIARADRLYITRVALRPDGDTVFPAIDPAFWRLTVDEPMPRSDRDSADARFLVYDRVVGEH